MNENNSKNIQDIIDEKYEKLKNDLFMDVLKGKINTYEELLKKHRSLLFDYDWEVYEELGDKDSYFSSTPPCNDILGNFIKEQEKKGTEIHDFVRRYLCIRYKMEEVFSEKKYYFADEDGNICDEYGNRLSENGEHRVFEVVKGGKE